jgi:hypothetical protein
MTENMITVALIVGDPGHEGLQLNEGSLAAAAKMIKVHAAATHGRWDAGQPEHRVVLRHRARPRRGSQGRAASHLGRQA